MNARTCAIHTASLLVAVTLIPSAPAQTIDVELPTLKTTDDRGVHAEMLRDRPEENLILPSVDTSNAAYLTLHYSKNVPGNSTVSALVVSTEEGDQFYIDTNNDEDLTNDGSVFFPSAQNELNFHVGTDSLQRVEYVLWRVPPENPDFYVDEEGNMKPALARTFTSHGKKTSGKKGTFFFDEKRSLRRGRAVLGGAPHEIGVYDYNGNGRFDEKADLLFVDLGRDGKLRLSSSSEVFKLDDTFEVRGTRYRVREVDPYGRRIELSETNTPVTAHYLKALSEKTESTQEHGQLDSSFWDLKLRTIDGSVIRLSRMNRQYILLNFWGEWCAPCLEEIPTLQQVESDYSSDKLRIIGMLHTADLEAAEQVMRNHEMTWPQVRLTEELSERFSIQDFPTNVLILPGGEKYIRANHVTPVFFDRAVR